MPKQSIPCPSCKKGRIYFTPPSYRIINGPEVSLAVMTHETPINCRQCDQFMVPVFDEAMIGQTGIPTAWMGVPKPNVGSEIALANPNDFKLITT